MQFFRRAIATVAILSASCVPAWAAEVSSNNEIRNPTAIWSAWGGEAELYVHPLIPEDIGLTIQARGVREENDRLIFRGLNLGSMEFHAPQGQFDNFISGSLAFDAPITLARKGHEVSFKRLFVEPYRDAYYPTLQLRDDQGRVLFIARQIHVYTKPAEQQLVMERMDLHLTEELAELLGEPLFANQFLGELALNANLNIPAGAVTEVRGGTCAGRPQWPTAGFEADVGLTNMSTLQDVGTLTNAQGTFELTAPSSALRNLNGLDGADVPWFEKFTGDFPPYNTDQHPYLVWNMYRFVDNRLEQIGVSGVKHAFLTINFNCTIDCGDGGVPGGNGHILWPGCEDVYGVGNNNFADDLGPRDEVNPRTGVFVSQGSFFDQDGNGVQDNGSDATGENRLRVLRTDLETAGADYHFESWYVIRDDADIFNSMGVRPFNPVNSSGDSWSYQLSPFVVGPAVDQWVDPATDPNTGSHNVLFENLAGGIGHLKMAVRTEDLGNDTWRYNYFLMNFDIEHGIDGVTFADLGSNVNSIIFHDPDADAANDWTTTTDASGLSFNAPAGNPIAWGTGYTFSFVAEGSPPEVRAVEIDLGAGAPQPTVTLNILAPGAPDLILEDGFEN